MKIHNMKQDGGNDVRGYWLFWFYFQRNLVCLKEEDSSLENVVEVGEELMVLL